MDHHEIAATVRRTIARLGPFADDCAEAAARAADTIEFGHKFNQAPPAHVTLNALRELTIAAEESDQPEPRIEEMRQAHVDATALFGRPLPLDGEPHEP